MTGRYDLCSTIQETDGSPAVTGCNQINVTNGTLTDNGDGTYALSVQSALTLPLSIANGGTNNSTAYTAGSVLFSNGTLLTQSNAQLFWDNTNNRLGIATASPGALLDLGTAGTTRGVLRVAGSTSGNVTIQPAAAAGTWTLTLPTSAGTANQVLQTDGTGITSWAAGGSGTPGGSNTQVQYNNASAFGGITNFTSNGTNITAATFAGDPVVSTNIDMDFQPTTGNAFDLYAYGSQFNIVDRTASKTVLLLDQNTARLPQGSVQIGNPGVTTGALQLFNSSGAYTSFQTAAGAQVTIYTLPGSDGANLQYLSTNGSGTLSWTTGVTVNAYTANATWTKPTVANVVKVVLVGGGGSGGGGQGVTAAAAEGGGTGGAGGAWCQRTFAASDLTATVSVTVGAQTAGGAGGNNANGATGTAGNSSSFGSYLTCYGGGRGAAGAASSRSGGGGGGTGGVGGNGGAGSSQGGSPTTSAAVSGTSGGGGGVSVNATGGNAEWGGAAGGGDGGAGSTGKTGSSSIYGAAGGGSGASASSTTAFAGGAGGITGSFTAGGGAAGGTSGGAGTAGTAGSSTAAGGGGGGGASSTGATGGAGGAGGVPGGGGGGGGAGVNASGVGGGAGGAGGAGEVWVYTW